MIWIKESHDVRTEDTGTIMGGMGNCVHILDWMHTIKAFNIKENRK